MKMRILRILLVSVLFLPELLNAQSFYAIKRERSVIATVGVGTSTYFGELANPKDYIDAKPSIALGLQYYFTNRISARAELTYFQLSGDDAKADIESGRRERNLSFTSNNIEFNTVGIIQLGPHGQRFYQRPKLNFYGFVGIGLLYFNPKTEYLGEMVALQPLQTEGVKYSKFAPVIPYGLGAKLMLSPFLNISIEGGYRKVFTDYLDDVSTVHKDPASFSDPTAAALADRRPEIGEPTVPAGTQRGNPDKDDGYMLLNVKFEYYLPGDIFGNSNKRLYKSKRKAYYKKRR
jgi:hypothetical protein